MTAPFGKIGSTGQSQIKSFPTEARANAEAQKFIDEKTRKGYEEAGPALVAPKVAAEPKAEPAPKAEVAPVADSAVVRRIRMPKEELDPPPIAPKPPLVPTRPFDLAALKAKAKRLKRELRGGWYGPNLPEVCTGEEARFWFLACVGSGDLDECLRPIPLATLVARFSAVNYHSNLPELLTAQFTWLDPANLVEVAARTPQFGHFGHGLVPWMRDEFWPRLDATATERVRDRFRKLFADPDLTVAFAAASLARDARLGADVLPLVQKVSKESKPNGYHDAVLLSLDDPAEIVAQFRRLGGIVPEWEAREYLARTKYLGLDVLAASVPHVSSGADAQAKMLGVLTLVEAPEAAGPILSVKLAVKFAKVQAKTAEWLDKHREHAAIGLAALEGQKGELGKAARAWLEDHRKRLAAPVALTPAVAKPVVPVEKPVAPPAPPRKMNLAPEDYRPDTVDERRVPRGQGERPFDLEAARKAVLDPDCDPIPSCRVSAEEARFWLQACQLPYVAPDDKSLFRALKGLTLEKLRTPLGLDAVKACLAPLSSRECLAILQMQRWLLAPADLIEAGVTHADADYLSCFLARWLEADVYPDLDEAAMRTVRERLLSLMREPKREVALAAARVALRSGLGREVADLVRKQKSLSRAWSDLAFDLEDSAEMIVQARRLSVKVPYVPEARRWLARTGHDALDVVRDSILSTRSGPDALAILDVLMLSESPEAAVALLQIEVAGKHPTARPRIAAWLRTHRGHALAGLTPLSADETPLGEAARAWLAENAGGEVRQEDGATRLRAALASVKAAKVPSFADAATLPPLTGLSTSDIHLVVSALMASTLPGPHPLVSALRRNGDEAELDAFAWKLFENWGAAGYPSKEKWAFLSLGHFGGDATVLRLAPLIRVWPGEGQHQRAVSGLEVLRTIGTDAALTQLNGMALKLKFKALQERARQMMDGIAADRGLSREQLEDRIVPDLGLDSDGSMTFDFGPRKFRFALSADLSPVVLDESGKEMKDLPKPGVKEAPKATEAIAAWKELKAQLRATLKVQVLRLEAAMVTGRSWTPQEFHTLIAWHPLLTHLVHRLVWEADGSLFRTTQTKATVGVDDKPVSLQAAKSVRVAHRLRLSAKQIEAWRKALDATELEPPFAQLERSTFAPRPDEAGATEFVRPPGAVPALKMRGTLEERGWRRHVHDHGGIEAFSKPYAAAGVTAYVAIDPGIMLGVGPGDNEDQRVTAAFFTPGADLTYDGREYDWNLPRARLGDVDAVAFSETVNDLMMLAPSGKG